MKLCISQATTLPTPFTEDVEVVGGVGWPGVEIWLTKLETHLETHSADDTNACSNRRT